MATGGNDYIVRLWDLNGMNKEMKSFRMYEPIEGQPIKNLSYCYNSELTLVITVGA